MAECVLATRGLVKRFGRGANAQTAVDHVSLHVEEGRVYGLLGPNGAGKSTTLKMITGMLRPTEGEMLCGGRPSRREVGVEGRLLHERADAVEVIAATGPSPEEQLALRRPQHARDHLE